ncbi:MAG: sulfur carrier protein ThiS [Puniceicoccales bacterium]|jgi:sulfur carrier protein|nr:sulfur carrier protein ThiS [Puniceicoccales bacterium]
MTILVNDDPREISPGLSLSQFMETLALPSFNGIAVAVNNELAPRPTWGQRLLAKGDQLLIIQATQGG